MRKSCCSTRMMCICNIVVGLLLAGSLLLAFWGIPQIIRYEIHGQTQLENGTEQWNRFVELPFPLDYTVRFFNVTNAKAVVEGGLPPELNETAPYRYKMSMSKTDIRTDDMDEDSVTYKRSFSFAFDSSGSTRENDTVTIVNPLLMAAFQLINPIEKLALSGCIDKLLAPTGLDRIFITKTVREILFDGITFAWANATNLGVACEIIRQKMIKLVEDVRVTEYNNDLDYLKISIFNFKTHNYLKDPPDGTYTINRGRKDMGALGNIMRWNGKSRITTFGNLRSTNNDSCQVIRGTDSTIYRPMIDSNKDIEIFNTDICRMVKLIHVSSDESYKGIKAVKYTTGKNMFRPSTMYAENDCYCSKATKDEKGKENCYLDGVFDFQPCIGAPVLASQPHFLYADKKYRQGFPHLKPNESKHGMYLLLEPNTGTPLKGMKRVQLNTVLRRERLIPYTPKTLYEGVIPILWLEEGFSLPQEFVNLVNDQYFKKIKLATSLKYSLMAVFASLFAVCLFITWRKSCFKNKKI